MAISAYDLKGRRVPALFTLVRSSEACICKSSGLIQSFIQSLKKQQWQRISGPWSLRQRYLIGGLEGGFWPLQAVQVWQEILGKELYSEGTKKKVLNVCVHTHIQKKHQNITGLQDGDEK